MWTTFLGVDENTAVKCPFIFLKVLTGSGYTWVSSGNGHVPPNAVQAGTTSSGQPLFVGRTHHESSLTPGKIHTAHGCLYFPYGGAEQSSKEYEVLICADPCFIPCQPVAPPCMPTPAAMRWMAWSLHQGVPPSAVAAGHDVDGSQIYVARAVHEGEIIPGKYIPSKNAMYVSWNGQEILKHHFDVYTWPHSRWVPTAHGSLPPGAVVAGNSSSGEPLYVGRTFYQGSMTPGKVHPSHGSLYIPFGGAEVPFKSYEVLVD